MGEFHDAGYRTALGDATVPYLSVLNQLLKLARVRAPMFQYSFCLWYFAELPVYNRERLRDAAGRPHFV